MDPYRRKPVVIKAFQFTGGAGNAAYIIGWIQRAGGEAHWFGDEVEVGGHRLPDVEHIIIHTPLEYDMRVDVGDFVVRGVRGEFYPVKNDAFMETYEPL